jgi:two-component sensor histidine kinase
VRSEDHDPSTALALRESHHRVANTFSVVSAALRCDLLACDDPNLRTVAERHEQRLLDFATLFRFLAIGAYAQELFCEDYFRPFIEILARSVLVPVRARCEVLIKDDFMLTAECERMALIICRCGADLSAKGRL